MSGLDDIWDGIMIIVIYIVFFKLAGVKLSPIIFGIVFMFGGLMKLTVGRWAESMED